MRHRLPVTLPPNPLARLVVLRRVEILAQAAVLTLVAGWLRIPLEIGPMLGATVFLAAANLATQWRLRSGRPVTDNEVAAQLCLDIGVLAVLLYYAGGSANPFVSLFLLPPTLAAASLGPRRAWAVAGIALAAYSFLLFWNLPLPPPQGELQQLEALLARASGVAPEHTGHVSGFALHVIGMWFNFLVSIVVVVFFLTRAAAALRARERELAATREHALRNEQILALGTLAAGAAHQLGTPLSTMAVVVGELAGEHGADPALGEDLALLREQIGRCRDILAQLKSAASGDEGPPAPVDDWIARVVDDWQLLRPRASIEVSVAGPRPAPALAADRTLAQAILNLLDNAADASGAPIALEARWDDRQCVVEILDRGPGIDAETARRVGQPFLTTKGGAAGQAGGLGIGLFLTNATVERFGGRVELFNREGGGACTRVTLPFAPSPGSRE